MPWFKIDDGFWAHPKTVAATTSALALWVRAGSWSAQQLTDGGIPRHVLPMLGARAKDADNLVTVGLWDATDEGWRFHDWRRWQNPDRPKIPQHIRRAVMERDEYACRYCDATDQLSLDHIHPWSRGGRDTQDNLQVLCMPCNVRKGARTA